LLALSLNPALDAGSLAEEYAACGRVRIRSLLGESGVRALHAGLVRRDDWRQMFIGDAGVVELDPEQRLAMTDESAAALDTEIHRRASLGFQYRYEGLRIPPPDEPATGDILADFASFMASGELLAFVETVIGHPAIAFGEGMATAYASGDFLTCHDDAVRGRDRLAAFVLGMTPQWRPEWGGLLLFHADDDDRAEALVPRFNTLDLFSVPQRHSVSYVAPSAPGRRLALTGWLRPCAHSST